MRFECLEKHYINVTNYHYVEEVNIDVTCFNLRYAIRESSSVVKIFKNFKEKKSFKPDFGAEGKLFCLWAIEISSNFCMQMW